MQKLCTAARLDSQGTNGHHHTFAPVDLTAPKVAAGKNSDFKTKKLNREVNWLFNWAIEFASRVQSFSPADWNSSEVCRQNLLWDWKLCSKLSWNDMLYPLAFGWYFKLRQLYCGLSLKLSWQLNLRWQMTIVSNLSVEVENSERSHKAQSSDTLLSFRLSFDDWNSNELWQWMFSWLQAGAS